MHSLLSIRFPRHESVVSQTAICKARLSAVWNVNTSNDSSFLHIYGHCNPFSTVRSHQHCDIVCYVFSLSFSHGARNVRAVPAPKQKQAWRLWTCENGIWSTNTLKNHVDIHPDRAFPAKVFYWMSIHIPARGSFTGCGFIHVYWSETLTIHSLIYIYIYEIIQYTWIVW